MPAIETSTAIPVSFGTPGAGAEYAFSEPTITRMVEEARVTVAHEGKFNPLDSRNMNQFRESGDPVGIEQQKLSALSMEWLTGDTDDMRERDQLARKLSVKPTKKLKA